MSKAKRKIRFHRTISTVHKWAGLILGVQILLWALGGFFMSWFPIQEVRGEHLRAETVSGSISGETHDTSVLKTLLDDYENPIDSWHAEYLNGQGVYRLISHDNSIDIYDSLSGAAIKPFSQTYIREAAKNQYSGPGSIVNSERLAKTGIEYRGTLPVWKIDFDDGHGTSFYISDTSGKLVAVRTDTWRFYDFMWMLHIMDYGERSDFNHPLLYLTSLAAIFFTVTGFILFFMRR